MNWFKFADKSDIDAYDTYAALLDTKSEAFGDPSQSWVKVPRKRLHNFSEGVYGEDIPLWWNGFEHIKVKAYWTSKNRLYLRLAESWELAE